MPVQNNRVYEPAASGDGYRVLVDRLWPRGVSTLPASRGRAASRSRAGTHRTGPLTTLALRSTG
ncbi:MAG: DUF488 family protein [Rhodoglobus sp.]